MSKLDIQITSQTLWALVYASLHKKAFSLLPSLSKALIHSFSPAHPIYSSRAGTCRANWGICYSTSPHPQPSLPRKQLSLGEVGLAQQQVWDLRLRGLLTGQSNGWAGGN